MKTYYLLCLLVVLLLVACGTPFPATSDLRAPLTYLTTADSSSLLRPIPGGLRVSDRRQPATIVIDPDSSFQEMDGFGFTLTGGSAMLLHRLPEARRSALLAELFGTGPEGIGISYLRLSLGASDLDAEVFSYAMVPKGETDEELRHFTLDRDREHLIPVLREILAVNPEIQLMASPWSPPVWMKDNGGSKGGSLLPEYYGSYAAYFVRYLEGMRDEGIPIAAVTVQNEPLHPGNNPSLLMEAPQQAEFVGRYLGPALEAAGLSTKIIIYDHNADRPDYPLTVLRDSLANRYVDGSAFHLYGGSIEALSQVHAAFPGKALYFTEQWIGAPGNFAEDFTWHTRELMIKAPRNWCRTVLEWNLAADADQEPHTPGGCTRCLGALTIQDGAVVRNTAYYVVAQAAKFIRPGAVRIASNFPPDLPNVAYRTPAGDFVVLVLNDSPAENAFTIGVHGRVYTANLPAGSAATYLIYNSEHEEPH